MIILDTIRLIPRSLMDGINSGYEFAGIFFTAPSIVKLHFRKDSRSISILTPFMFWTWGIWNLIYYPYLHQWISFSGAIPILVGNTIWLLQVWTYRNGPSTSSSSTISTNRRFWVSRLSLSGRRRRAG